MPAYRQVVEDLTGIIWKDELLPFHLPIRENEQFVGYVNVCTAAGKALVGYLAKGQKEEVPDPFLFRGISGETTVKLLLEAVAETSEEFHGALFRWRRILCTGDS